VSLHQPLRRRRVSSSRQLSQGGDAQEGGLLVGRQLEELGLAQVVVLAQLLEASPDDGALPRDVALDPRMNHPRWFRGSFRLQLVDEASLVAVLHWLAYHVGLAAIEAADAVAIVVLLEEEAHRAPGPGLGQHELQLVAPLCEALGEVDLRVPGPLDEVGGDVLAELLCDSRHGGVAEKVAHLAHGTVHLGLGLLGSLLRCLGTLGTGGCEGLESLQQSVLLHAGGDLGKGRRLGASHDDTEGSLAVLGKQCQSLCEVGFADHGDEIAFVILVSELGLR